MPLNDGNSHNRLFGRVLLHPPRVDLHLVAMDPIAWRKGISMSPLMLIPVCLSLLTLSAGGAQPEVPIIVGYASPNTCPPQAEGTSSFTPIAAFEDGRWSRDVFEGLTYDAWQEGLKPLTGDQSAYVQALCGQMFQSPHYPNVRFDPERHGETWIGEVRHFTLLGKLTCSESLQDCQPFVLVNRPCRPVSLQKVQGLEAQHPAFQLAQKAFAARTKEFVDELEAEAKSRVEADETLKNASLFTLTTEILANERLSAATNDGSLENYLKERGLSTSRLDEILMEAFHTLPGGGQEPGPNTQPEAGDAEQKKYARCLAEFIIENRPEKKNPEFDAGLYATPMVKEALAVSVSEGKSGLWLHITRAYPKDLAPEDEDASKDFPMWQQGWYAYLRAMPDGTHQVLWEMPYLMTNPWSQHRWGLRAAFDANGDGVEEIVLTESGHEYYSTTLYAMDGERLSPVAEVAGGL